MILSNKLSTGAPIKIDTSMTTMAVSPNIGNGIGPSYGDIIRKSINKSLSTSPRPAPANITGLNSPWSPVSPINSPIDSPINSPTSTTMNSPVSCVSPVSIISSPTPSLSNKSGFPSPKSRPITPKSKASSRKKIKMMRSFVYSEKNAMKKKGYVPFKSIGTTLQGSIWKVKSKADKGTSVIKVTKKSLHDKSVAIVNGTEINIQEDIIKETAVLRYLSSSNPPKALAKFESFWSDKKNYFLAMEDGGNGLFEHVTKCHKFINDGKLSIKEWHRFCKIAFKQMVELLHWMHNTMNCCHLDLSLENFVIDNVMVLVDKQTDSIIFADDFQIKMVDFGLAEVFTKVDDNGNADFRSQKYVGKTAYKAPKVFGKRKVFDARAADCWSLGVVLFMMIIGGAPYKQPCKKDATFQYVINGKLIQLLQEWNRIDFVTPKLVDLLLRVLRREEKRINIDEIKKHPWLL